VGCDEVGLATTISFYSSTRRLSANAASGDERIRLEGHRSELIRQVNYKLLKNQ